MVFIMENGAALLAIATVAGLSLRTLLLIVHIKSRVNDNAEDAEGAEDE